MSRHELHNYQDEPAPSEQLGALYDSTVDWLVSNIPPLENRPFPETGFREFVPREEFEGWPVSNGLPRREITIPGSIIRAMLPEAAEQLELGDSLHISHDVPHFHNPRPGKYVAYHEHLAFLISKQSDLVDSEYLTIEPFEDEDEEGGMFYESDRDKETKLRRGPVSEEEFSENIFSAIASQALAHRIGVSAITQHEHAALSAIIARLDDINAAMHADPRES